MVYRARVSTALAILLTLSIPVKPVIAQRHLSVCQWTEDIDFVANTLREHHVDLFHTMTEQEFQNARDSLQENLQSSRDTDILVGIWRLVAMVGDGHTKMSGGADLVSGRLPMELYSFSDGLFIKAADRSLSEIVGSKILQFGDWPADDVVAAVSGIASGDNRMTRRQRAPGLMIIPEVLSGVGVPVDQSTVTITYEGQDDSVATAVLRPVSLGADIDWVGMRADGRVPLYLRHPDKAYWYNYLQDNAVMYVQFNAVRNSGDQTIAQFFEEVFHFMDSRRVHRLILDIRHNGGGNAYFNHPILEGIAEREELNRRGNLYVIVGRGTFSAAQTLATLLEKRTDAIFVGEATGGRPNHYGDADSFKLPNSGLTLHVSSRYWQDSLPDDTRPWIEPDIWAELSSADYHENRDPALAAILDRIP